MNPGQPVTHHPGSNPLLFGPPVASAGHASKTAGNHLYGSMVIFCSDMLPILNRADVQFRYDTYDGESPAKALASRQAWITVENHCPPNQLARELTRAGKCSTDYFVAFCQRMARAEKNPDAVTQSPLYPLYQELSHIHCKAPSLPGFIRYLATGQHHFSAFSRPYLQTMIDLCQVHPGITLHQLMAGLDHQSQEGLSEAVQSLLRFRDHRWEAPAVLPEKAQEPDKSDDSALTGSASARNTRQRLTPPCSGLSGGLCTLMGNFGRAFSEEKIIKYYDAKHTNLTLNHVFRTSLKTACSIGDQTFKFRTGTYYVFGMAPDDPRYKLQHAKFCSIFCVAPDLQRNRYQTHWAREIGVQRCTNAMNKMTSLFSENRTTELCTQASMNLNYPIFDSNSESLIWHGCLDIYANKTCQALVAKNVMTDPFCDLCDAAKDPAMRCNPLPKTISGITIDNQEYPLAGLCDFSGDPRLSYQGYHDICQEYCINNKGAPIFINGQDLWRQVGEARCQKAKDVIGQVFDVQTAHHNFSCNPVWDTTARIPLNKTGCLLEYLDQKCRYLVGANQTSDPFCNLCDASRDPAKRCNPIPETISGSIPAAGTIAGSMPPTGSIPSTSTIPASIPAAGTIPGSIPATAPISGNIPAAGISVMAASLIGTTVGIGAFAAITGLGYLYHRWRKGSESSENSRSIPDQTPDDLQFTINIRRHSIQS